VGLLRDHPTYEPVPSSLFAVDVSCDAGFAATELVKGTFFSYHTGERTFARRSGAAFVEAGPDMRSAAEQIKSKAQSLAAFIGGDLVLYGCCVAPIMGATRRREHVSESHPDCYFVYDVFDLQDKRFFDWEELVQCLLAAGLPCVPLIALAPYPEILDVGLDERIAGVVFRPLREMGDGRVRIKKKSARAAPVRTPMRKKAAYRANGALDFVSGALPSEVDAHFDPYLHLATGAGVSELTQIVFHAVKSCAVASVRPEGKLSKAERHLLSSTVRSIVCKKMEDASSEFALISALVTPLRLLAARSKLGRQAETRALVLDVLLGVEESAAPTLLRRLAEEDDPAHGWLCSRLTQEMDKLTTCAAQGSQGSQGSQGYW
jgi:hypothetical protein